MNAPGTVTALDGRRAQFRVTRTALRLLERMRTEAGDVVLVVAPRLSDEVLCIGRRDLTLGPNDVLVGRVGGCPVYVDRRAWTAAQLSTMVLDAQPDLLGPKFVLRPAVGQAS